MTDLSITDLNERLKRLEEYEFERGADNLPDVTGFAAEATSFTGYTDVTEVDFAGDVSESETDGVLTVTFTDTVRRSATIPTTQLADTDFVSIRVYVPVGETLSVYAAGVETDQNTAPAGLTAEVDTESGGSIVSNELSANNRHTTGDPLCTVSGGNTAAFRVENDSGAEVGASAFFEYDIQ